MNKDDSIRRKFLEATGKVISKKRKQHKITQKELGEKIGVSATTIGRYESGQLDIPVSNLPLISNHCDFKLREYLFGWESDGIESFVKEALSNDNSIPDQEIVKDFINSCEENEMPDLEEISFCVNNLEDDYLKKAMSKLYIEKHLKTISTSQYKRLLEYYQKLHDLKNQENSF